MPGSPGFLGVFVLPDVFRELGEEGRTPGWAGDFSALGEFGHIQPSLSLPRGFRGISSVVPKVGRLSCYSDRILFGIICFPLLSVTGTWGLPGAIYVQQFMNLNTDLPSAEIQGPGSTG